MFQATKRGTSTATDTYNLAPWTGLAYFSYIAVAGSTLDVELSLDGMLVLTKQGLTGKGYLSFDYQLGIGLGLGQLTVKVKGNNWTYYLSNEAPVFSEEIKPQVFHPKLVYAVTECPVTVRRSGPAIINHDTTKFWGTIDFNYKMYDLPDRLVITVGPSIHSVAQTQRTGSIRLTVKYLPIKVFVSCLQGSAWEYSLVCQERRQTTTTRRPSTTQRATTTQRPTTKPPTTTRKIILPTYKPVL